MKNDRDFERAAAEWLDAGSDSTPPYVIDAILLAARNTPQERDLRIPWRTLSMKNSVYAVAVIAAVAVAGLAALYAFGPGRDIGSGPATSPSEQPTLAPAQTPAATPPQIDTRSWTYYQSDRYGWSIAHPADWSVTPAEHDWTLGRDADDVMSSGQEMFVAPAGNVRVSAWSVAINEAETPETPAGVAAWIERYCEQASGASCTSDLTRAVPLCVEPRDCHPGLLVPFQYEVQAFFTGGIYHGQMVVVTVWWGEDEPAVAPFGGSQRLLEAFISTMAVWPESVPFEDRQCFGEVPFCVGS